IAVAATHNAAVAA
ncbi:hypothetical protein A2U01_0108740, partial [Trifolium medium]|nr:hypothetical protein [Trifolium medium]